MNTYPTAPYRGAQRVSQVAEPLPGFQRPVVPATPRLPVPANDPLPANDNFGRGLEKAIRELRKFGNKVPLPASPPPGGTGFRFPARYAVGFAARANWAKTAYDVYQLVKPQRYSIIPPSGYGMFAGPYEYPYPYNGAPSLTALDFNGPLTGQSIGGIGLDPASRPERFGVWVPDAVEGYFYAHHASFARAPGDTNTGVIGDLTITDTRPDLAPGLIPSYALRVGDQNIPAPTPYWAIPYRVSPSLPNGAPSRGQPSADPLLDPVGVAATSYEVVTEYAPGRAPVTTHRVIPAIRQPPPKDTKERKFIVAVRGIVDVIANIVTESVDGLDAIWESIPEALRPGMHWKSGYKNAAGKWVKTHTDPGNGPGKWVRHWNPSPQEKAEWIYNHYNDVDVKDALENIAKNEIQDSLIGGANKRVTKAWQPWYRRSRRMHGFGTGPIL